MIRKMWTQEDIDILSKMYPDHFAKEIAGVLGRGVISQEENKMIGG